MVGSVDADHVRGAWRAGAEVLDGVDGDRLQAQLASHEIETVLKPLAVHPLGNAHDQGDREVSAEDRHLGVLEVAVELEQRAADPRDDPGAVAADGGHGELGHASKIRRFVGAQQTIERERRWATPAATAAVLTFALYVASFIVDRTASLYTGASDARQLVSLHENAGTILVASVIRALAFLLLPIPLLYLFRAAQARNPRIQSTMVAFIFIGPILFAAQGVVQAVGAGQAASDFVDAQAQHPEQSRAFADFQHQVKSDPGSIDKVTIYTGQEPPSLEVQRGDTFYTVSDFGNQDPGKVVSQLPGELDGASPSIDHETESDAEAQPGDARATHTTDNAGTLQVSQALLSRRCSASW